jgi:hypothetical protein
MVVGEIHLDGLDDRRLTSLCPRQKRNTHSTSADTTEDLEASQSFRVPRLERPRRATVDHTPPHWP